jgi:hypothetical protein
MTTRRAGVATLLVSLLVVSVLAQPSPRPRVREVPGRKRVSGDPLINPATTNPHPGLPTSARREERGATPERHDETWAAARWTTSTLQLPGNAKKTISVAAPSIVLIRASWPDQSDLTVRATRGNTTLASAKGIKKPGIGKVASTQVKVPSPGNIVIGATGPGSPKVTLYVGILPTR